jgi:hypothetical protein
MATRILERTFQGCGANRLLYFIDAAAKSRIHQGKFSPQDGSSWLRFGVCS